jgi:hypothetical protein
MPSWLTWKTGLAALGAFVAALLLAKKVGGPSAAPLGSEPAPSDRPVDPYSAQETTQPGQCDPTPKPGVLMFRKWALEKWGEKPGSPQNIVRDCAIGPNSEHPSEHHEGRAWDMMTNSLEHGQSVVDALTAADPVTGEPDALARRAGIMYMIWNKQMWRAYPHAGRPSGDWQPYTGGEAASPHTDHVHFSFSRAGAAGDTSLYDSLRQPSA